MSPEGSKMTVKFCKNNTNYDTGECLRGLNLLGHAHLIELDLGSTCGGHGKCGKDRVVLSADDQSKVNALTEIEKVHLSKSELEQGFRLACQCFPNEDRLELSAILSATQ